MSAYPEVAPAISIGIHYGDHVADFEVDVDRINTRLRERGLTDQQIIDTTIIFSDAHPPTSQEGVLYGEYAAQNESVVIYGNYHALSSHSGCAKYAGMEDVQQMLNSTLVHELEHRVAGYDDDLQRENTSYSNRERVKRLGQISVATTAGVIGSALVVPGESVFIPAMSSSIASCLLLGRIYSGKKYSTAFYLNQPEEKHCRQVEKMSSDWQPVQVTVKDFGRQYYESDDAYRAAINRLFEAYWSNVSARKAEEVAASKRTSFFHKAAEQIAAMSQNMRDS